jgi:hypothetical protein
MNGSCAKCGKHGYLMHLHGEKGGPLFCPLCAGAWNAEHSRRRKFARIALKAMTLYLENGGSLSALDKFTSALALARLGMGSGVAGYRVDTIGNEIGDLTSAPARAARARAAGDSRAARPKAVRIPGAEAEDATAAA